MNARRHDECPGCVHQSFVHGLAGGCSVRSCDCTRDNNGRERSAVKLGFGSERDISGLSQEELWGPARSVSLPEPPKGENQ